MNMPSFNDILQKLSVFKNNLSLLVPIIIALVGVLLFIPTQLMSSRLKSQVEQESINKGAKRIASLERNIVSLEQSDMEAERRKAHAADANEIAKLAVQTTQRELLSYVIIPAPDANGFSGLIFQQFGQNYSEKIDKLILQIKGRDCPTDAEIKRSLENSSSLRRRGGLGGLGMAPDMYSPGGYEGGGAMGGPMMYNSVNRVIIDGLCLDRAKTISVYVNPIDIAGYEYWKQYKYDVKQEDALKDCWYHQLACWIIEDVFATIEAMNSGSVNVIEAPVKRVMGVTFTMGLKGSRRRGGGTFGRRKTQDDMEEADRPAYVLAQTDGLSESCSGRFCGDDIHVTHFNFSVLVSAKSVLPFMKELCSGKEHQFRGYPDGNEPSQTFKHNQITILESKFGSIDPKDSTNRYYRYGDEPLVLLELVCEYIFNKKGYEVLIPEPVEKTLAGEDEEE